MYGGSFNPRPRSELPTQAPEPSLGSGFLNNPKSVAMKKAFVESANSLAKILGLTQQTSSFNKAIKSFYGQDALKQVKADSGLDTADRIDIFSDINIPAAKTPDVPAGLAGMNLQEIIANQSAYQSLSYQEGVKLLKEIRAAVERVDTSCQDVLSTKNKKNLRAYGAYNSTLFAFFVEMIQKSPAELKAIFTPGNQFFVWAMNTLDTYAKQTKNPDFNVPSFKKQWQALADTVTNWGKLNPKKAQTQVSQPMLESNFMLQLDNRLKSARYKEKYRVYKEKKEEQKQEKIEAARAEARLRAKARARRKALSNKRIAKSKQANKAASKAKRR